MLFAVVVTIALDTAVLGSPESIIFTILKTSATGSSRFTSGIFVGFVTLY